MLGRFRGMALSADAGLASIDKTRRLPLTETAIGGRRAMVRPVERKRLNVFKGLKPILYGGREVWPLVEGGKGVSRSEEHTSELQSLMRIPYAVFCLKKKNNTNKQGMSLTHQDSRHIRHN